MRISYSIAILCCFLVTTDAVVPYSVLRNAMARAEKQQDYYETQARAKISQDDTDKNDADDESKSDESIERRPTSNMEDAKATLYRQMLNHRNRGNSRRRESAKSITVNLRPSDIARKVNRPENFNSAPVKEKTIRTTSVVNNLRGVLSKDKKDTDTKRRVRNKRFRPNAEKCCKVGERIGKKRFSCDINAHSKYSPRYSSSPKLNYSVLFNKAALCSKDYSKNFNKCCRYRAHYVKEMDECKKLRGYKRRNCRKTVRHRYP